MIYFKTKKMLGKNILNYAKRRECKGYFFEILISIFNCMQEWESASHGGINFILRNLLIVFQNCCTKKKERAHSTKELWTRVPLSAHSCWHLSTLGIFFLTAILQVWHGLHWNFYFHFSDNQRPNIFSLCLLAYLSVFSGETIQAICPFLN